MASLTKSTAIATLLALALGAAGGTAEAAMVGSAARSAPIAASAQAGFDGARVELIGGRHWRGGRGWGRPWRHRHHDGAAVALGAAGAIIGLSALAAANAQAYAYAPPPVYYAPPDYVYEDPYWDEPYDDEVVIYETPGVGTLDAYAPPPPPAVASRPSPRRIAPASAPAQRSVARADTTPEPWSSAWYKYCASKYRSFNPETGYFTAHSGEQKFCR
ncbi:BA14K family protein [Rhodoligotrophos defluvii]|uniref:BA14K family protein n=1 Tax=Rhodoligotrophos defluvii TaxID=2561934 RepID=UPI001EF140F1|nr:BA14K family protein [Rhodoligotrophos defluvii]